MIEFDRVLYRSYRERLCLECLYRFFRSVEGLQGVIAVLDSLQRFKEFSEGFTEFLVEAYEGTTPGVLWSGCIEGLKEGVAEVLPGVHGSGRL